VAGSAAAERLASAETVEKAVEVQADYARSAYESLVTEATKMTELCAELVKGACKPFETVVARSK
jgi:hypothetical protein